MYMFMKSHSSLDKSGRSLEPVSVEGTAKA